LTSITSPAHEERDRQQHQGGTACLHLLGEQRDRKPASRGIERQGARSQGEGDRHADHRGGSEDEHGQQQRRRRRAGCGDRPDEPEDAGRCDGREASGDRSTRRRRQLHRRRQRDERTGHQDREVIQGLWEAARRSLAGDGRQQRTG
jgi:hypothetical protein